MQYKCASKYVMLNADELSFTNIHKENIAAMVWSATVMQKKKNVINIQVVIYN